MSEPDPASGGHPHRRAAPAQVATAVVTVSDTRTARTDSGGATAAALLEAAGHPVVARELVPDEKDAIAGVVLELVHRDDVRAVILTGGSGVSPRDVTPDAVEPLLERRIPGFGELFRMLSYEQVGSAALLSRAVAGLLYGRVVVVLPGSPRAVTLAMQKLVLPELGHLAGEAVKAP